jgi:Ca-activated chloride channel family protein
MLKFAHPWWLLALLLIPLYWLWQTRWQNARKTRLPFTRLNLLREVAGENKFWRYLFPVLRALTLLCLILALAQPRWGRGTRDITQKGVDIVLAVDISGSMLALDFAPQNRLAAAVKVARDFISKRPNDRFGLVAFSEYALTQSPLTYDHISMLEQLGRLEVNQTASATAIGLGLAKAVARLKDSNAKSKVVILITDGVSNTGEIDPETAARMASSFKIKVYPIGVGTNGFVDFPITDPRFGTFYSKTFVELDMETLNRVAQITGTGKAAQASDSDQLQQIMDNIDTLETTEYKAKVRYIWTEQFMPLLWTAFALLLLELILRLLVMPVLPE